MSQISVNDLTFYYDGSYHNIFETVSFQIPDDSMNKDTIEIIDKIHMEYELWKIFERVQFNKKMEEFSAGEKKKVLIEKSL